MARRKAPDAEAIELEGQGVFRPVGLTAAKPRTTRAARRVPPDAPSLYPRPRTPVPPGVPVVPTRAAHPRGTLSHHGASGVVMDFLIAAARGGPLVEREAHGLRIAVRGATAWLISDAGLVSEDAEGNRTETALPIAHIAHDPREGTLIHRDHTAYPEPEPRAKTHVALFEDAFAAWQRGEIA